MNTATHCSAGAREGVSGPAFVSLAAETRTADLAVINPATLAALEKKGRATIPPSDSDAADRVRQGAPPFVSLDRETRAAVDTATAAYHLNRQPQTLRCWAVYESGPIRAFRMHGRLMWPTARLRELCGVA